MPPGAAVNFNICIILFVDSWVSGLRAREFHHMKTITCVCFPKNLIDARICGTEVVS